MKTSQVMQRKFDNGTVHQRTDDGYFNANSLVALYAANTGQFKHPSHFLRNESTKEFLKELADHTGISEYDLYTRPHKQSCWMHPLLFLDFAMWLSPEFKLKVLVWLHDNLITFRNQAGDYYKEMTMTISDTYEKWAGKKAGALVFIREANYLNSLIGAESGMRNELSEKQLNDLNQLQLANIKLMKSGLSKSKRHEQLKNFYELIK